MMHIHDYEFRNGSAYSVAAKMVTTVVDNIIRFLLGSHVRSSLSVIIVLFLFKKCSRSAMV